MTKVNSVEKEINAFRKLWKKNKLIGFLVIVVIALGGVIYLWSHIKGVVFQGQKIQNSPNSIQLMTGSNTNIVINKGDNKYEETSISPNAYLDIIERLKQTGYISKYIIEKESDFSKPIDFLMGFVETKNKINLSPILVTLQIHEININRDAYFDKVTPMDAIEYLRSHLVTKRYPLEVIIYPAAVMKISGKGAEWKVNLDDLKGKSHK